MPEFSIPSLNGDDFESYATQINKMMLWLLNNLDDQNVKRLRTEYCQIQSENGETTIDGPLFIQKDGDGNERIKMGWDKTGNKFTFEMKDPDGNNVIYFDGTTGEGKWGGTIETSKDARVGNNLYLGTADQPGETKLVVFAGGASISNIPDTDLGQDDEDIYTRLKLTASSIEFESYLIAPNGEAGISGTISIPLPSGSTLHLVYSGGLLTGYYY